MPTDQNTANPTGSNPFSDNLSPSVEITEDGGLSGTGEGNTSANNRAQSTTIDFVSYMASIMNNFSSPKQETIDIQSIQQNLQNKYDKITSIMSEHPNNQDIPIDIIGNTINIPRDALERSQIALQAIQKEVVRLFPEVEGETINITKQDIENIEDKIFESINKVVNGKNGLPFTEELMFSLNKMNPGNTRGETAKDKFMNMPASAKIVTLAAGTGAATVGMVLLPVIIAASFVALTLTALAIPIAKVLKVVNDKVIVPTIKALPQNVKNTANNLVPEKYTRANKFTTRSDKNEGKSGIIGAEKFIQEFLSTADKRTAFKIAAKEMITETSSSPEERKANKDLIDKLVEKASSKMKGNDSKEFVAVLKEFSELYDNTDKKNYLEVMLDTKEFKEKFQEKLTNIEEKSDSFDKSKQDAKVTLAKMTDRAKKFGRKITKPIVSAFKTKDKEVKDEHSRTL